jgi:hypothetical protein
MADTVEELQKGAVMNQAIKQHRLGNWMRTATGNKFWPEDPRSQDVYIADIAHHLSMLCRFTGAVRKFYSVAEHSVHVSNLVEEQGYSNEVQLQALLHDATEAYIADINRPAKASPLMQGYKTMEGQIWFAIAHRFNVPVEMHEAVHKADVAAYYAERDKLMYVEPNQVDMLDKEWHMPGTWVMCWTPEMSRHMFLERYRALMERLA